jgi:hypothetical protein
LLVIIEYSQGKMFIRIGDQNGVLHLDGALHVQGCVTDAVHDPNPNPVTCKNLKMNKKAAMSRLFWTRQVYTTPGSGRE